MEIAELRVARRLLFVSSMQTIDNDILETVTGGAGKAKAVKGIAKLAKTALKWGGYAMDAAGTFGSIAEGASMIKSTWDSYHQKPDAAPAQ
jgi:hypothetical protein